MDIGAPDIIDPCSFEGEAQRLKPKVLALFGGAGSMSESAARQKISEDLLTGTDRERAYRFLAAQYALYQLLSEGVLVAFGADSEWKGGAPHARWIKRA